MTPQQIDLVQTTFKKIIPQKGLAGVAFYSRLFELAPEVRPLFKNDMTEQGSKLVATLAFVVNGLKELDTIVPIAAALAAKHISYGVTPYHYKPVGVALIWTLEQALGPDFTEEVREAWLSAYAILSQVMIDAAYGTSLQNASFRIRRPD